MIEDIKQTQMRLIFLRKEGIEMDKQCYKVVDDKGRILIPSYLREASGINKNDVIQISVCGKVILINKVRVEAEDPLTAIRYEEKRIQDDKNNVKDRIKALIAQGLTVDEILDEAIDMLY